MKQNQTCCTSPVIAPVVTPRGTPFASEYIVRWKCTSCGRFVKEPPPQIAEEEPISEEEAIMHRMIAINERVHKLGGIVTRTLEPGHDEMEIELRVGLGHLHFYRSFGKESQLSEKELEVLEIILEIL